MVEGPILLLLRRDLRVADHPALTAAVATGRPVIPVYIHDMTLPGRWAPGGATRWWLAHSLARLDETLRARGSRLVVRRGPTVEEIVCLASETAATGVYLSRSVEPWAARIEAEINARLAPGGIEVRRFAGTLLFEPEAIRTGTGGPFRVYSPFARACFAAAAPRRPIRSPSRIPAPAHWPEGLAIAELDLLPTQLDWAGGLREMWRPGEAGAIERLDRFLEHALSHYHERRDRPDLTATSQLSPHLHFGEVSIATVWHRAADRGRDGRASEKGVDKFLKELLWREFSSHLLHHHPDLPEAPFRPEFTGFPWRDEPALLRTWQKGLTGYPIVDAGMRELWSTGWMHNRVRMIVGSFLVKDLLVPWQEGEAWFWDTLVDADLANNAASWQWIAGSGADAAPFFRIFNPVKQGITFDPDGAYVRRWVPELARLPASVIHAPWEAPALVLAEAGIAIGRTYPARIVDHKMARERALAAFQAIKAD